MSLDLEAIARELIDTAAELTAAAALVESGEIVPSEEWDLYAQTVALASDLSEYVIAGHRAPASFQRAFVDAAKALDAADAAHYDKTGTAVVLFVGR
jgi:hypothetical protein